MKDELTSEQLTNKAICNSLKHIVEELERTNFTNPNFGGEENPSVKLFYHNATITVSINLELKRIPNEV